MYATCGSFEIALLKLLQRKDIEECNECTPKGVCAIALLHTSPDGFMKAEINRDAFIKIGEVLSYLQMDCYLGKSQSAKYLGVGLRTFETWMDRLPRYRPGGKPLFKRSE